MYFIIFYNYELQKNVYRLSKSFTNKLFYIFFRKNLKIKKIFRKFNENVN